MTAPLQSRKPRLRRNIARQPFRILVGSCGDPDSEGALHLATLIARRKSAAVHVMAVATPFPHKIPTIINIAPPAIVDEGERREALERLRRQLATVRGTRSWAMRATVGFVADSIVDAGIRWPASLVVVGLGKHGFVDRLIHSETAVTIARRSIAPVLAVPSHARRLPLHAIAAIDFSDASIRAAMAAATLLGPDGRLTLIHASVPAIGEPGPGTPADVHMAKARVQLAEIADRIRRMTRRRVDGFVTRGEIVEQLVHAAADHACDLIALGSDDASPVERLLTGSVRTQVMRAVDCSVLVIPARPGA